MTHTLNRLITVLFQEAGTLCFCCFVCARKPFHTLPSTLTFFFVQVSATNSTSLSVVKSCQALKHTCKTAFLICMVFFLYPPSAFMSAAHSCSSHIIADVRESQQGEKNSLSWAQAAPLTDGSEMWLVIAASCSSPDYVNGPIPGQAPQAELPSHLTHDHFWWHFSSCIQLPVIKA